MTESENKNNTDDSAVQQAQEDEANKKNRPAPEQPQNQMLQMLQTLLTVLAGLTDFFKAGNKEKDESQTADAPSTGTKATTAAKGKDDVPSLTRDTPEVTPTLSNALDDPEQRAKIDMALDLDNVKITTSALKLEDVGLDGPSAQVVASAPGVESSGIIR